MPHCTWSLISGHPAMMYPFSHHKCSSCAVACCIYWIDMHSGTFIDSVWHPLLCPCHVFSSSLFSMWLCWHSQSAVKSSYPSLYIILPSIDVSLGECTGFTETGLLCLSWILLLGVYDQLLYLPLWQSNNGEFFWETCNIPNASFSMLLYLHSALVRLLLANAIGLGWCCLEQYLLGMFVPSLVCNRVVPSPIPDASVSRYRGLISSQNIMHTSSFINDFVLSYRAWYEAFYIHTALLGVSFSNGSHTFAVLGEYLPK